NALALRRRRSLSTQSHPSVLGSRVDAIQIPTKMPSTFGRHPLRQTGWSHRANVATNFETWRRHQFPIVLAASQCPTSRDFVPWPFCARRPLHGAATPSPRQQKPSKKPVGPTKRNSFPPPPHLQTLLELAGSSLQSQSPP